MNNTASDTPASAPASAPASHSAIGPDREGDLRTLRPYFLAPVLEPDDSQLRQETLERIRRWVARPRATGSDQITDIFIFAHGWHENFFRATSVYDRLCSRVLRLWYSGRIHAPEGFQPLFLNLHYHSDPGQDDWRDHCGRRDKESFLKNAAEVFQPAPGSTSDTFTHDFEAIFAFFTHSSNPESPGPSGSAAGELDREPLLEKLSRYQVREAPGAKICDKAAAAWACYHEAEPEPVLEDQQMKRRQFLPPFQAMGVAGQFLAAALKPLKLGALAILLVYVFRHRIALWFRMVWNGMNAPFQGGLLGALGSEGKLVLTMILALALVSWLILWAAARFRPPRQASKSPTPPVLIAWIILQFLLAAPLVLFCLFTFAFGGLLPHPWLSDERIGRRNEDPNLHPRRRPRYVLAQVAQYPATLLRRTAGKDSKTHTLADKVDAQLSFWLMQQKSIDAGAAGARFLADLLHSTPQLSRARIHLLGHSFGVLIVPNLVRHAVLDPSLQEKIQGRFHARFESLCLLGAAFGANWFEGERRVREAIHRIGCVYSRYDTANSFYYPFANHGRIAAGSVGLFGDFPTQECGGYVVLSGPPELGSGRTGEPPAVFNIDASRILYKGKDTPGSNPQDVFKPGAGGSHDDIFNDDAMYLFWAITGLEQLTNNEAVRAPLVERDLAGVPSQNVQRGTGLDTGERSQAAAARS